MCETSAQAEKGRGWGRKENEEGKKLNLGGRERRLGQKGKMGRENMTDQWGFGPSKKIGLG